MVIIPTGTVTTTVIMTGIITGTMMDTIPITGRYIMAPGRLRNRTGLPLQAELLRLTDVVSVRHYLLPGPQLQEQLPLTAGGPLQVALPQAQIRIRVQRKVPPTYPVQCAGPTELPAAQSVQHHTIQGLQLQPEVQLNRAETRPCGNPPTIPLWLRRSVLYIPGQVQPPHKADLRIPELLPVRRTDPLTLTGLPGALPTLTASLPLLPPTDQPVMPRVTAGQAAALPNLIADRAAVHHPDGPAAPGSVPRTAPCPSP